MPSFLSPDPITILGDTDFRDTRHRFGIKHADRRRHIYILGRTGTGKSTLLENMTVSDLEHGHGLAVIDPHGDYAERMLDFVPRHRTNDVIYLNPADADYPIGLNIMESVRPEQRPLVAGGVLDIFKKIWPDSWSQRMEYFLGHAILALLETPGTTLLGVNRIFTEPEFRKRIISRVTDPIVRRFWEKEFAHLREDYVREAAAAILNKLGQYSAHPLIRNIVGQQRSGFDFRRVMDEGKILIVNLSKGRIGEEASRLLGALIVTKLYLAAMSRADTPEPNRRDFMVLVDEFQNFATESFASMDPTVQQAVLGNVGTMISFRVGAEDAELLEREFHPHFSRTDLVNLPFAKAYVKLMIDGTTSHPFSAETLPPPARPSETRRDLIIRLSRQRYATPRTIVDQQIARFARVAA